jgi:hypothetical protein
VTFVQSSLVQGQTGLEARCAEREYLNRRIEAKATYEPSGAFAGRWTLAGHPRQDFDQHCFARDEADVFSVQLGEEPKRLCMK